MITVSRNIMTAVKGVGAGMLIGGLLGAAGGWAAGCGSRRTVKKRIGKAADSVTGLLDSVTGLFR